MGSFRHILAFAAALFLSSSAACWATGAIAVDDAPGSKPSDAGYGIGFGDDKDSAMRAAVKKCQEVGNDSCKVTVWFEKCGAYASSIDRYGVGWGDSKEDAESKALSQCAHDRCRVVASECDDD